MIPFLNASRPPEAPAAASPLALLRQLDWKVRHAVENILSGEYRSAFRGRGMEFDQVVKYEFGDDVRDIDWNVTARLGEPYRKKFVEEREISVMILFEDSPSLQFGSGAQSKREALLELAGIVMLLGSVNRDRVGLLHVTPTGYTLREPVCGRAPILHSAATLFGSPPPAITTDGTAHDASLSIPWRLVARAVPRHSVLIWLSDFAARPAPEAWNVTQRRYLTLGFRVDDPWDRTMPYGQAVTAYDPVSGRLVSLDGSDGERQAHAAWSAEREAAWRTLFPDTMSRLVVSTEDNRLEALVKFFHARMRRGRV